MYQGSNRESNYRFQDNQDRFLGIRTQERQVENYRKILANEYLFKIPELAKSSFIFIKN